jgi:hypothetical protein
VHTDRVADFLKFYPEIDRIRLIGSEWTVTQQWASVNVPWTAEYLDTSFKIHVGKEGPAVIVLSQPDDRYFRGLTGRHRHELHFRLYKVCYYARHRIESVSTANAFILSQEGEDTYLLRSMEDSGSNRACSAELTLSEGTYNVFVKITTDREDEPTYEEIIRTYRDERREKLLSIGKSFDAAHSQGRLRELEIENAKKTKREEREKEIKKLRGDREDTRNDRLREKAR